MLEAPTTGVQTPDELLVRRAREGDGAACEELFHRHRNNSYQLAYRYLGNEQDALDVVQEAMTKAFSALGEFDGRSGFRTWLLRIVVNTSLDWGRRRKRRPSFQIGSTPCGQANGYERIVEDDPARGMHQQDLRQILERALNHLSPTIRTTFVLFAELGMSYKEIAETQDIPIGTVMSRIHSAREKLQAELDWDQLNGLA
jgi:RNA polymerase sigma-70 factor, ECF subfamily